MFKNEAAFFPEWIEFHRLVGVDHFYLYNNFSSDAFQTVLQPYLDEGIVTLTDWPVPQGLVTAFQHCLQSYGSTSQWIACMDLDEYLVPTRAYNVPDILRLKEAYPMVAYFWKLFGTGGQLRRNPDKLVCEQFTQCATSYPFEKTIYNTSFPSEVKNSHYGKCKLWSLACYSLLPDRSFKLPFEEPLLKEPALPEIQINHYWSKSYEDALLTKLSRGLPDAEGARAIESIRAHDLCCTTTDTTIFRFMTQLKLNMGLYTPAQGTRLPRVLNAPMATAKTFEVLQSP
jgi:Glycosyltransferase family 92